MVSVVEVASKPAIVVEPPELGVGKEQKAGAFLTQGLEMRDRICAVRRIVAQIKSIFGPRKMPGSFASRLNEFIVSLTDNEDDSVGRNNPLHYQPEALQEAAIGYFIFVESP